MENAGRRDGGRKCPAAKKKTHFLQVPICNAVHPVYSMHAFQKYVIFVGVWLSLV